MNGPIPPLPQIDFLQCEGPISMYLAIFQVSAAAQLRPSLFCDVDAPKVGSFCCPETSVTNYQPSMCNITDGQRLQFMYHNIRCVCKKFGTFSQH